MSQVYNLDGFDKDTVIMPIGHPDETEISNKRPIPAFTYTTRDSDVFFSSPAINCRIWQKYLLYNHGIHTSFSYEECYAIASLPEFKEMPCFPEKGSVKLIDNIAVIKFEDITE